MKICITGSFGNQDIGDDAMLETHLKNLDELGVDRNDITLVGHQQTYTQIYFGHLRTAVSTKLLAQEHDCLIVTGGGTINTRDKRGKSLHRMYSLVMPFADRGKPVFMSGQTIGPLGTNSTHDDLARKLVDGVDVLTVRDHGRSKKYLDLIGAKPKELIETIDDATDLPYVDSPLPEYLIKVRNKNEKLAAVNITRYTFDSNEKMLTIIDTARLLIAQGYHVLLVPHTPGDYNGLKDYVTIELSDKDCTLLDTRWNQTQLRSGSLKRAISICDLAIGGRYHFLVFALSTGVPCVGMTGGNVYSYQKQRGFAEQVGWGDYITAEENPKHLMQLLNTCKHKHPDTPPKSVSFDRLKTWLEEI